MKPLILSCTLGIAFTSLASAIPIKSQDFDGSIFSTGAESGPLYFNRTGGAPVTHASTGGTDLGFAHDGLISTSGGIPGTDVAAGVIGGEFHIKHYSSTYTGSALDFGNPRTGSLHSDSVDLTGFKNKTFSMDIHDIGLNAGNDDVVVRLLVNGGTTITLLDTRPQPSGTAGIQTLEHAFNDMDISAQLLIDLLSDDNGDGYGFDNIEFEGVSNPDAPVFYSNTISRAAGRATVAYSGNIGMEADDPNGDPLEYAKVDGPEWLTVAINGALSGTPTLNNDMGTNQFTVLVTDNNDGSDTAQLVIPINDQNGDPPPPDSNTEHYRIIWDDDPSSKATIAWKQISGANGAVYYGTNDFGRVYTNYPSQKTVDKVGNFTIGGTIDTCFARLTGLQPDMAYYFVIKDDAGVSPRYWFLTAPDTPKPFTFIGGGDSRSNPEPRRKANRMVAKLRPLFVCFTGDMINTSVATEWNEWFGDWQETICSDGRVIPLIPYRGNHEGYDAADNPPFFELFDTTAENYFSFSVGGSLMRFYVLNSEMDDNATKWNAQTSWLTNDLAANAAFHTHLAAGYHKPMRPHNSGKSEGTFEYAAWAQPFYDHGMNVVFEADSHTVKRTWPIKPDAGGGSDESFIRDDANGTVYTGEGCWGAPLRSADDLKAWTRDAGMFYSFDWVHVYPSYMELYTIMVDNEAAAGNLQEGDVFSLPSGIDLWKPANGTRVIINNHAGATLKSYAQWQLDQWGAGTIPANTEALADFDGDGYNNLTEFAYGLDPQIAAAPGPGIFPVIAVDGSSQIEIDYRRETDTSLTYVYEFSSDLITWDPMVEGVDFSQRVTPDGGNEWVVIELLGDKETASVGFIRVTCGIQ